MRASRLLAAGCVLALGTVACSSAGDPAAEDVETTTSTGRALPPPVSPALPQDFTWTGRYLVPDLGVEVPFVWNGRDGDFQMTAGGEDQPIHFTNLIVDGELYTVTYLWPDVPRLPCSHVGPFSVAELNEGLATASFVGRETHYDEDVREVYHYRSTGVVELFAGSPEDELPPLRLPLMAGDFYVDVDDHTTFWKVLHFGLQNLYDPNLDEWIVIDDARPEPGEVTLPAECLEALQTEAPGG